MVPVAVEEFRIGPGETYDVEFIMPDGSARTIFAQSIDRTGFARGTNAPAPGMAAPLPSLDARPWLDPVDMMGARTPMDGENARHGTTRRASVWERWCQDGEKAVVAAAFKKK